ncbi:MAG: hypothetical protein EOP85_09225, partial [Verrucomicrobiaceae bacterium]
AVTRGPGAVLMPPHMGNWEVFTRMSRVTPPGYPNGAFYRPLNNPLLDRRVHAQREAAGCHLFAKQDSFHMVTAFIRNQGIFGILADQRVGPQGDLVRFFGRLTRASPLPALLTRRTRSEAVAISLVTEAPGKWRARYHTVEGRITTESCMDAIERAIKTSPIDYFWLQERWKVEVRPSYNIRQWLGDGSSDPGKQHRALLWLPGTPESWELPEEWTHPDVNYEVVPRDSRAKTADPRYLHLRFHANPKFPDRKSLRSHLEEIDSAAALPIDYILTCGAARELVKAAASLSIRLVSLPRDP